MYFINLEPLLIDINAAMLGFITRKGLLSPLQKPGTPLIPNYGRRGLGGIQTNFAVVLVFLMANLFLMFAMVAKLWYLSITNGTLLFYRWFNRQHLLS